MSDYNKCPICNEYHWTNDPCGEKFSVYHEDYFDDEPKTIHASSFNDAALKYAKYYNGDCSDHPLLNDTIQIKVVNSTGVALFFEVGAEPDIYYSSTQIESLDKK